ncbi:MAG TPA: ABC transporter ATP-binding protein [Gemmatimonadales bacterium]|nr:ABC transporter ATP-binding protein [Gemmatimonadales bacterium]
MSAVLIAQGVRKVYEGGDGSPLEVLAGVDLEVRRGEFVSIVGASGAGKSTLLHLLGALDRATEGRLALDGVEYAMATDAELGEVRNRKLGFIFQFHHLLREFTALENVMMPLLIAGQTPQAAEARAHELLDVVGLSQRVSHRPAALSGGEQQRVAVARALANDPDVILADEPSGNLDHAHSERLHDLLASLTREFETALVVVTHNRLLAARADRVLAMEGGRLVPVAGVEAAS